MSVQNISKLNLLLRDWPLGTVCTTAWLNEHGYSGQILNRYKQSGWIESSGTGAWVRSGDQVSYEGAVYAMQNQLGLSVHPGGKTALSFLGKSHFLELSPVSAVLLGQEKEILPSWCKKHDWGIRLDYHSSSFLPASIGMTEVSIKSFSIRVSSAARAIMECLYLARTENEILECYEIMEGMNDLRPNVVVTLLEHCNSIKVKRLFLFMAEKAEHQWLQYVDLKEWDIDLGKGKRSLVKNGFYEPKYQITVPKELGRNGSSTL